MPVLRVNKTKNYTVMSNYHLKDNNLSLKAKGLLSIMLSLPDDWDYSIDGLVSIVKEGKTTVENALDELKREGYVVMTKLTPDQTESGRFEYVYDIYESPESDTKQGGEKQGVENLPIENLPLYKYTNKQNTKNNNILNTKVFNKSNSETITKEDESVSKPKENTSVKKKQSRYEKCVSLVNQYTNNEKLASKILDFLEMRLSMKDKPMYANQFKALLEKLDTLATTDEEKIKIVTTSLEKGWASFYENKEYSGGYKKADKSRTVFSEYNSVNCEKAKEEDYSGELF